MVQTAVSVEPPSCLGPSFPTSLPPAEGLNSQYPGVLNEEVRNGAIDRAASKEMGCMLVTVADCWTGPSSGLMVGSLVLEMAIGGADENRVF